MGHVCHWRHAYWFDHALRRVFQKPERIAGPYVREGATVLDLGCGMGFFSLVMARLVGDAGRVIAVDLQPEMLSVLMRRARRKGVAERIRAQPCTADSIGVGEPVDFALAMWVVHELPDMARAFAQVRACLKPGAKFLVAEPKLHVNRNGMNETIRIAEAAGLKLVERPHVGLSHAALFGAAAEP
ncbi:MAG: class I SAM-dependent methyltransferase [Verrucomicrobia bacterium]|nr:class I SAM-dependent methyltransferase [Verrucomicrobiota bacterium]